MIHRTLSCWRPVHSSSLVLHLDRHGVWVAGWMTELPRECTLQGIHLIIGYISILTILDVISFLIVTFIVHLLFKFK